MQDHHASGWVLYDQDCRVCSRWVPFWAGSLRKAGLDIAPLQSAWVREELNLPEREVASDLRILLHDGRRFRGADAYRYAMSRIWWLHPVLWLSLLPGARAVFNSGYRMFALHRHQISRLIG